MLRWSETINDFMLNINNRNVSKPNLTWQKKQRNMEHGTTKTSTSLSILGLCTTSSPLDHEFENRMCI